MTRERQYEGKWRLGVLIGSLRRGRGETALSLAERLTEEGVDGGTSGTLSMVEHGRLIPGLTKGEGSTGKYIWAVCKLLGLQERDRSLVEDAGAMDVLQYHLGPEMTQRIVERWRRGR